MEFCILGVTPGAGALWRGLGCSVIAGPQDGTAAVCKAHSAALPSNGLENPSGICFLFKKIA